MDDQQALNAISTLSHTFGSHDYVRGGGGNTSCKSASTLYIKPSGTSLAEMEPGKFLPLSRDKLNALYNARFSTDVAMRESEVVAFMAETVLPGHSGRPSVEAPLHNCFPQRFVVHTHPAAVNGLTCGKEGRAACAGLFPDALWMPFTEPGYTLAIRVREAMARHQAEKGVWPQILMLGSHGVFIAHDDAEGIAALYSRVMTAVNDRINAGGLAGEPERSPAPLPETADAEIETIKSVLGADADAVAVSGRFDIAAGAVTPDHIVYCRPVMFSGNADALELAAFRSRNGYWPRVIATPNAVYGVGASQKVADLALELAWDGALVVRYAGAFGGIRYLEQHFVDFIANWEVESYRQKVSR